MNVINQKITEKFVLYNGDSCEVLPEIPSNSIHYSIFSPPFRNLYTYSNSERDLGNCKTDMEFKEHFGFIVNELFRVIMPGRLLSFHCANIPMMKEKDGFIGLSDFRGELIQLFQDAGFIFHSEVCIWKNPATEMQRTKSIGLLYKQLKKDGTISRQGIPDYLITMRKPGENPECVTHTEKDISVDLWQKYASPVWFDIEQNNTLNTKAARENENERHICPLQLDVIERALTLWTNPGDIVLTPFLGIGSEAYQALKMGRNAIGIELKESYYNQAVKNCENAISGEQLAF